MSLKKTHLSAQGLHKILQNYSCTLHCRALVSLGEAQIEQVLVCKQHTWLKHRRCWFGVCGCLLLKKVSHLSILLEEHLSSACARDLGVDGRFDVVFLKMCGLVWNGVFFTKNRNVLNLVFNKVSNGLAHNDWKGSALFFFINWHFSCVYKSNVS